MDGGVATASNFARWVFEESKPAWRRQHADEDWVPTEQILRLGEVDHGEIERIKASIPNELIGAASD